MAKDADGLERPEYSEKDKTRARQWFKKGVDLRERHNYDYAIESFVTGLSFWMDGVEEGVLPLWSLAIQRQQAGGKKPGMMESMKKSTSGKDVKQATLNALTLLAKDPASATYVDALVKNCSRGGFLELGKWAAERGLESLRRDKKAGNSRFKAFRENLVAGAAVAEEFDDAKAAVVMLEHAVQSVEVLIGRNPTDMALKDLQRDLSGKLTIAKGKYTDAGDFRDSLQDADSQKVLHDAERMKQGEGTQETLLDNLRKEFEENRDVAKFINAYVNALLKTEDAKHEAEAIKVLEQVAEELSNYNFKQKADDVRLRQLARACSKLKIKATESGDDGDMQQLRLAAMEENQATIDIYRERVAKYPTELKLKAKLGEALFKSKQYEEAIPLLQAAQNDPRSRIRCQLLIGQAFLKTGNAQQAAEVLQEAIDGYDREDETAKALLFNLGKALVEAGQVDEAQAALGKLVRLDYNYANGKAREILDRLKKAS